MDNNTLAAWFIPGLMAVAFATNGANVTYLPGSMENGIYDWRTVGNWYYQGGGAYGGLPGAGDNVRITNATFAAEWLVLPAGAEASVKSLNLQVQNNASLNGIKMKIDGGKLTTTDWSCVGNQGNDATLSIENGGSWTAGNTVVIGYGGASNCQMRVDSGSTFSGNAMQVHNGGGGGTAGSLVAFVENDGVFTLSGDLTVGYRDNNKASNRRSRFENGGTVSVANACFGRAPQTHATLVNRVGGSMEASNAYIGACTNATGVFVNEGEFTAKNAFSVGDPPTGARQFDLTKPGAAGYVTNRLGATISAKTLSIAWATNSVARIRNDGTFAATGSGTVAVGREPGADGELVNYGTLDIVANQWNLGHFGRGRLEIGADTSLSGRIFMGAAAGGSGELSVTNGATLATTDGRIIAANDADSKAVIDVFEESTLTAVTNLTVGYLGHGVLRLHGGTMTLRDGVGSWFSIGRNNRTDDISNGRLEGWGTVSKTTPSAATGQNKIKMNLYNGVVQADGGGAARDLDLRLVQDMNESTAAPNTCGTNGWYAVNGARLRYPARYHSGGSSRIVGDYGGRSVSEAGLPLVNSFGVSFADSILANNYIYADLYANDRADIPAGLPEAYPGAAALGVWRAALSSNYMEPSDNKKVSFGDATVLVHYDGAALKKLKKNGAWPGNLKLALLVHDGMAEGRWRKASVVEPSDSPFISGSIKESSDYWNMGWFAVVPVKANGMAIVVR